MFPIPAPNPSVSLLPVSTLHCWLYPKRCGLWDALYGHCKGVCLNIQPWHNRLPGAGHWVVQLLPCWTTKVMTHYRTLQQVGRYRVRFTSFSWRRYIKLVSWPTGEKCGSALAELARLLLRYMVVLQWATSNGNTRARQRKRDHLGASSVIEYFSLARLTKR